MNSETFLTPGMLAGLVALASALIILGRDWMTQRSLKLTLANIKLHSEIAAAEALAAKEADALQAAKITKIAEDTQTTKEAQLVIGIKVDGHMTELRTQIVRLEGMVTAGALALTTEKDKAALLAIQAERDWAAAAASLTAAQQVFPPAPDIGGASAGDPGGRQVVTIPELVVPVEDAPPRIVRP